MAGFFTHKATFLKGFILGVIVLAMVGIGLHILSIVEMKGRDVRRKEDILTIQRALYDYSRHHKGKFPSSNNEWVIFSATPAPKVTKALLTGAYLISMPKDPVGNAFPCNYYYKSEGKLNYTIRFCQEDLQDGPARKCPISENKRYCHATPENLISDQ